ncbi:hypothetical protein [Nocardia sp. NPDC051833]|uniref:hypothetical protein n=1 Tax=Nocardia sp. NPDC051833 TaxID=3155674 RepID=UPI0034207260
MAISAAKRIGAQHITHEPRTEIDDGCASDPPVSTDDSTARGNLSDAVALATSLPSRRELTEIPQFWRRTSQFMLGQIMFENSSQTIDTPEIGRSDSYFSHTSTGVHFRWLSLAR